MEKYTVSLYDEKREGDDLIVAKTFYNADEADAYAREWTKKDCDWARVFAHSEGTSTIYKRGKILD